MISRGFHDGVANHLCATAKAHSTIESVEALNFAWASPRRQRSGILTTADAESESASPGAGADRTGLAPISAGEEPRSVTERQGWAPVGLMSLSLVVLVACGVAPGPSTEVIDLPLPASGEWSYNASPTIQDNLTTADGAQYAVWVDDRRHPVIGRRDVQGQDWETFDLATIEGNPLGVPTAEDGHNFYSLAVDSAGVIHLAGNHHVDPLRYVKSSQPHRIDRWELATMVLEDEDAVTYPKFFRAGEVLLFTYRNGSPGNGDQILNRYDATTGTWGRLHTLVDGTSTNVSFYPNHISTRDGSIHLMGVWRGSEGVETTHDVVYMRSGDGGESWLRADGSPQEIPLQPANADIALDTAAKGSGLLNGGGLEVDSAGRPHGALLMHDEEGRTQVFHIWWDGDEWSSAAVTGLDHRMAQVDVGYVDNRVSHPSVVTSDSGATYILYRAAEHGDRIQAVDVTPGLGSCEFTLTQIRTDFWNPTFDTEASYDLDRLVMLVVPTSNPNDPTFVDRADEWASVEATVVELPLEGLDDRADQCRRGD